MSEAVLFAGGALALVLYFSSSDSKVVENEPENQEVIIGGIGYGQPGYINPVADLPVEDIGGVPYIEEQEPIPGDIGPAPVIPPPQVAPPVVSQPEPEPEPAPAPIVPPPTGRCNFHASTFMGGQPDWAHENKERCFEHSNLNTYQTANGELYTYQGLYNPTPAPDPEEEELISYDPPVVTPPPPPQPTGPILGTCTITPPQHLLDAGIQPITEQNRSEGYCYGAAAIGGFSVSWNPN